MTVIARIGPQEQPNPDPQQENSWAGQGAVLLDIGGDVGALVVRMPRGMVGREVEIRPLAANDTSGGAHAHDHDHGREHGHEHGHEHAHWAHVAVVERPVGEGSEPSLVFPELVAGGYELFVKGHQDAVALEVEVSGGAVTETRWARTPSAGPAPNGLPLPTAG